jgi:hypothetical protein
MDLWNWLTGGSSGSSGSSPVFSYVLMAAAVLLLVAVIFGELEDVAA